MDETPAYEMRDARPSAAHGQPFPRSVVFVVRTGKMKLQALCQGQNMSMNPQVVAFAPRREGALRKILRRTQVVGVKAVVVPASITAPVGPCRRKRFSPRTRHRASSQAGQDRLVARVRGAS